MKSFFKITYNKIPFKVVFFNLIKKFIKLPESIYKHLHFNGEFSVEVDKNHKFKMIHFGYQIENEIYWAGINNGWEKECLRNWIRFCKISNVIIDVGANTGIYSLIAKCINPNAEIYAFEPIDRIYTKLELNTKINNFNINLNKIALSNKDGETILYDRTEEHYYSATLDTERIQTGVKTVPTKIKINTLNTFIKTNNLKKIDLIKIDVEGHESEVLEGYKDFLIIHKPVIFIEVLFHDVASKIEKMVSDLNYSYFNIDDNLGLIKMDRIVVTKNYNYLLCKSNLSKELNLI